MASTELTRARSTQVFVMAPSRRLLTAKSMAESERTQGLQQIEVNTMTVLEDACATYLKLCWPYSRVSYGKTTELQPNSSSSKDKSRVRDYCVGSSDCL